MSRTIKVFAAAAVIFALAAPAGASINYNASKSNTGSVTYDTNHGQMAGKRQHKPARHHHGVGGSGAPASNARTSGAPLKGVDVKLGKSN